MLITLDWETYYDDEYSLRKMTTTEYIRDARFEAMFVAIKIGKRKTRVYAGPDQIKKGLAAVDWGKAELLCHHTHFDGLILSHHFGIVPKFYRDTLSMSRAWYGHHVRHDLDTLSKRQGRDGKIEGALVQMKGKRFADLTKAEIKTIVSYAGNDVDQTYAAYLCMLEEGFPLNELPLVDLTVRMYAEPKLHLDEPRMEKEYARIITDKEKVIKAAKVPLTSLTSNAKFAELLRKEGIEPPTKTSPTTGEETYAFAKTDLDFTELVAYPKKRVQALVKARLAAKSNIEENRAARLRNMGGDNATLPVYLVYCGAHTTRWSGGDKMNWQNLPAGRQGKSSEIRRSIIAPKGFVVMVVDSSQIEARVNAWNAGHEEKLNDYRAKVDLYCKFASIAYGREITKKNNPDERHVGKTCELGLGFGMGGPKLHLTLARGVGGPPMWVEPEICVRLVRTWRGLNEPITEFWEYGNNVIISDMILGREGEHKAIWWEKGRIWLPSGLPLLYPGLRGSIIEPKSNAFVRSPAPQRVENAQYLTGKGPSKLYGGLLTENIVQALARCVVGEQMQKVCEETGYPLVMSTHDEGAFLVPEKEADQGLEFALKVFATPPAWAPDLPVAAEGGYDYCYSK